MDAEAPVSLHLLCWGSLRWPSARRAHPRQCCKSLAEIELDIIQGSVSYDDPADGMRCSGWASRGRQSTLRGPAQGAECPLCSRSRTVTSTRWWALAPLLRAPAARPGALCCSSIRTLSVQFAPLESASPSSAAWPLPAAMRVLLPRPPRGPSLRSREPPAMHGSTRGSLQCWLSAGV